MAYLDVFAKFWCEVGSLPQVDTKVVAMRSSYVGAAPHRKAAIQLENSAFKLLLLRLSQTKLPVMFMKALD